MLWQESLQHAASRAAPRKESLYLIQFTGKFEKTSEERKNKQILDKNSDFEKSLINIKFNFVIIRKKDFKMEMLSSYMWFCRRKRRKSRQFSQQEHVSSIVEEKL